MNLSTFRPLALNLALAATLGAASLPPDWAHYQTVQIDQAGLVKISVPLESLDAARPALEDLRLYDDAGREVPFRVDRPVAQPKITRPAREFQVRQVGEQTVATFQTGLTQALESVTLETPARDFIKPATVEGSADGTRWEALVQGAPVFGQPDGTRRLEILFPAAAWPWLRITLDDRRGLPIPLTGAQVRAAAAEALPAELLEVRVTEREESASETRLTLQTAGAHVVLAELTLETAEPLFTRPVTLGYRDYVENDVREIPLARGTLYRVAIEGQTVVSNLTLAREIAVPARELTLTLHNGDSPPLPITGIRARRRPVYLTWFAQAAGAFHVLSGNARCASPRYDLASLPAPLAVAPTLPRTVSSLVPNPAFRAPEALPELQSIGTAIDLGLWRFRKPVALSRAGVQQVELDPETLARAASSFADLRVVRDGRQLPYLLERSGVTRRFAPSVMPTNDPKRPTVSQWILTLPQPRLPLTELTCETDAPFFQRRATLTTEVFDERHNPQTLQLASTTWVRTLEDRKKAPLRLALGTAPSSDRLLLEVENGDNSPLVLTRFQLSYPAARVLFKAGTDAGVFLYYGNPAAPPPSYDIALVARQLLAAEKAKAVLGPAEALQKEGWLEREGFQGVAGWIFWGVLGVVVIGLLIVVARLLPKPQA